MKVRHLKRRKPHPGPRVWIFDIESWSKRYGGTVTGRRVSPSPSLIDKNRDWIRARPYQENFLIQMDFADLEARVIAQRNMFAFNYGIKP